MKNETEQNIKERKPFWRKDIITKSKLLSLIVFGFYILLFNLGYNIPHAGISLFGLIAIWGSDTAIGRGTTIKGLGVTIPSASSIRFIGWIVLVLPLILFILATSMTGNK